MPTAKSGAERRLVAAGTPFGVKFHTDGVLVAGICGGCGPAADAGLRRGDVLTSVDGAPIRSAAEFAETVRASGGRTLSLGVRRSDGTATVELTPIADESGEYKLGIWVKDSAAGIGTVTFIDPETLSFAGLGHGICDSESGALIPFAYGSAEEVRLSGVTAGRAGVPGELRGSFSGKKTGKLLKNVPTGVYGMLYELPDSLRDETYPVASRDEVSLGKAYIFSTVDDGGRQKYEIEITEIEIDGQGRNFSVRVTDEALLAKTGGIVQGMSGSPILQNGKLIGAVTHVLISDPTAGYGIFIENMLSEMTEAQTPALPFAA